MISYQVRICDDCRQTTSGHCGRHPLVHAPGWPVFSAIPGAIPGTISKPAQPREPDLADQEAARLLRLIANRPQEAVIWPLAHGRWSGNVVEALLRGAERLDPEGTT